MGYDTDSISKFVGNMLFEYPKPSEFEVETSDINAMAIGNDSNNGYDFDCYNEFHMDALEALIGEIVDGQINSPDSVTVIRKSDEETGEFYWEMFVGDVFIISYKPVDGYNSYTVNDDYDMINKIICNTPDLLDLLQVIMRKNT